MNCFKCDSDGHLFADCPERAPRRKRAPAAALASPAAQGEVKDYDAHLAAINAYVAAWQRGEITTGEKRRAISDENLMFYGEKCRPSLLWEGGPGDNTRLRGDARTLPQHSWAVAASAAIAQGEADEAAQAAGIRDAMGWSEEKKEQRRREKALAQVAESRSARR